MLAQLIPQSLHQFPHQLSDLERLSTDFEPGFRPCISQNALKRPGHGPTWLPLRPPRLPPISAHSAAHANQRRKPVANVTVRCFEVNKRIVATVCGCDHDTSCTKIYAE